MSLKELMYDLGPIIEKLEEDYGAEFEPVEEQARFYPTLNRVVERSLHRMQTEGEGHMPDLMVEERVGGNAGSWNGHYCLGANFQYDERGEILHFDNIQHVPVELRDYKSGTLRVALLPDRHRIVGIRLHPETTDFARQNIETAVNLYNASKENSRQ